MVPVLASILIGVGVKVGLGLAATAAKKFVEPAAAPGADSFPSLLKTESPAPSALAGGAALTSPAAQSVARVPYDLPGRLAAERLHGLALDVAAQRGVPGPGLSAFHDPDGPLAAYRRLDQAP